MNNRKYELIKELIQLEVKEPTQKISGPNDMYSALIRYVNKKQEHFLVITLDGANKIIKKHMITKGIVNRTLIHPRETFRPAIKDNACSIIIAHNHPSGNNTPSSEDNEITKRMVRAGELLGIQVLDHLIISSSGYYSYQSEGRM